MKALVIGGSGFLGSHVVDELIKRDYEISIFDKHESIYKNVKTAHTFLGELTNIALLEEAIAGQEYIFMFASIADIKEAHNNPYKTIEINVLALTKMLELCVKHQIKKVIYASTIYVYSNMGTFYKASKQCAEIIIESFFETYQLPYSIVRYGSLYGPRANYFNFIHNAIYEALTQNKITRQGDGTELRDYIHVEDAAVATVNQIEAKEKSEYIMITGNQTMQVKEVLNMIKEMLQNKINIEFIDGQMEGHYLITPYYFKPRVAKKIVLNAYHDLGQGIFQCIDEVYQEIEGKNHV